ncbi:uncharacterized protein LOC129584535 isoform X2 [Paramacrobiotus metropolitanus]|uniref:uncharacterized protein LOC129584535 isoform X2 n=1 Tax=Paramacrobiotus metropolitanus TaxID=2943436 RepID=UPI002445C54A|nr:uncharacterized protein LOC129584535 isoform X2 [Paramacrobiotus metropolitanus]
MFTWPTFYASVVGLSLLFVDLTDAFAGSVTNLNATRQSSNIQVYPLQVQMKEQRSRINNEPKGPSNRMDNNIESVNQQAAQSQDVCETYSFVVKNAAVVRDDSCGNNSALIEEVNEAINKLKAQSQVDREMRHRLELQVLHETGENQKLKSELLANRAEMEKLKNQILQLEVLIWREKFMYENQTGLIIRELQSKVDNMSQHVNEQLEILQEYVNGRIPVRGPDGTIQCHFEKTPNAGILHYNDKQLRVNNVMECLKACLTETMFNCRSVDYLRTGTNHQNTGECLLSKDNHFTVPEENFNSYVGWDYYIKICK